MSECLPLWKVLLAEYKHLYPGETLNPEPDNLDKVVELLHKKDRAALCISGGGIRSASFALGVIQGLAKLGKSAADSVLNKIDYLSTVSGGGYVGSWLSGWAWRKGKIEAVIDELRTPTGDKLKPEPQPVHHLREYSNYLTPQLGLLSADTWAFFGAYFRNLLLMLLVLVPFFLGILALPRLFVSLAVNQLGIPNDWFKYVAAGLFYWSLAFVGFTRPTAKPTPKTKLYSNGTFQILCLLPLCLFAVTLVIAHAWFPLDQWGHGLLKMIVLAVVGTVLSSAIYTIRKIRAEYELRKTDPKRPPQPIWMKQVVELVAAAVSGTLFAVMVYQFLIRFDSRHLMPQADILAWVNGRVPLLSDSTAASYIVFGVPLVILALLLQSTVFVGGTGRFNDDFDREWWGRAAAWVIIAGIGWIVITAVVIYGPVGIYYAPRTIGAIGGVTGLFAVGAGKSGKTGAKEKEKEKKSTTGAITNMLLGLATPIFALILLAALSLGTTVALRACLERRAIIVPRPDQSSEVAFLQRMSWTFEQKVNATQVAPKRVAELGPGEQKLKSIEHPAMEADKLNGLDHLLVVEKTPLATSAVLVLAAILFAILASWLIGVNRFSMHALYRDRIIRGYLAASNTDRKENPFTGFDPNDNIPIKDLQSLQRPIHVVNMCLNLTSGEDLAWQERKAESFTASPLHCGSLNLGYRPSDEYGGPKGMKLGTAVGISGAAASPNMGYHSSPALALLLTFFNVRLGWWLGNPKNDTTYKLDNPTSSLRPLLAEALGMSGNKHPYIYLSDGGHFENLGFYEMVLRRCRHIIVSDGGSDADFVFEDLGKAIRKIYIDFGIHVVIEKMELFPRATAEEHKETRKYCATGRIFYADTDGKGAPEGTFVYIKPVFYEDQPRDIYNYAKTNDTFPHQSTGDQFFSESQLESYRKLGEYAVNQICKVDPIEEKKARTRQNEINTVEEFITEAGKYANPVTTSMPAQNPTS
ncbi:MAG: patatin-like phospholipase family protein [Acidobacteriota bacterium]